MNKAGAQHPPHKPLKRPSPNVPKNAKRASAEPSGSVEARLFESGLQGFRASTPNTRGGRQSPQSVVACWASSSSSSRFAGAGALRAASKRARYSSVTSFAT